MKGKISAFQFFAIVFLCRITEFFTYIAPRESTVLPTDRVFVVLFFLLFCILALIPAIAVAGRFGKTSVPSLAKSSSNAFGKVTACIYITAFIWSAAESVSRFELFISTVMFPDTDINMITALLLLAAAFAAAKGTEAIGRSSVTVCAVLAFSFVFIILTSVSEFDAVNFSPVLYNGVGDALRDGFSSASRTWEVLFFATMLPQVNGSAAKSAAAWLTVFSVVSLIGFCVIDGVTGQYGDRQMFKLYTLTVLAKLGILERFDDVLIGIWVLCELIKASFCMLAASKAFEDGFGKKAPKYFYLVTSGAVFAVFTAAARSVGQFAEIAGSVPAKTAFYICALFVPITVAVVSALSQRKAVKKLA